ncbi:CaiB/BaiF CoA transferase family protein [Paralcaligenes ureilyticus]|uniref:Formyl-CoA transferase/CoA:oxalate CoA-transferase n=1 Tax=Paralcaligenes ureilyticus TaxID=627131 RepID=A0A4R3M7X0_9BURK|nr:CoA transferase [Paralcaligenes ureilyticus]TCT09601.1 formyl-CoA transferase/CoA:oxalate CoA-transferase [Paralcaligenes ureilyticus]
MSQDKNNRRDEGSLPKPLAGIKVLDLTRVIAGPYCTMMLADMGADVVKIEEPSRGDELRWVGRYQGRADHDEDYFNASNRSKRSIALNLKDQHEQKIASDLARVADVVVENFSPGVAERLGMGWQVLSEQNPGLIYCSISGFGQSGPYRNRLALDPIIQAVSGVMSVTGHENDPPMQIGAPLGDVIAGMFGAYSIAAAIYGRSITQKGRYIDISMQDSMLAVLGPRMGEALQAGLNPKRHGNENPMRAPANSYQTKGGDYIAIIVQNDNHWENFCKAIGRLDLFELPEFRTMENRALQRKRLNAIVAGEFLLHSTEQWMRRLDENRIPHSLVNTYLQALDDIQVKHRKLIKEVIHPASGSIRLVGAPWKFNQDLDEIFSPPMLGQHTREVLQSWLGRDEPSISSATSQQKENI